MTHFKHFSASSDIEYWTIIHITVVAEEHLIFRARSWSRYDFDAWDKPALLPFGWEPLELFALDFLGLLLV